MSKPKPKRNKPHRPRMPSIPMMRETRDSLAMALHAAVETLIHRPGIDACNAVSLNLMTIGRACGKRDCIEAAKQVMIDIYARHERVGKIGASAEDAAALRLAAGALDGLLAGIPVNRWVDADLKTAEQYRVAVG